MPSRSGGRVWQYEVDMDVTDVPVARECPRSYHRRLETARAVNSRPGKNEDSLELNGILFNFGLPRRRSTAGYDGAYDLPAPGFLSPEGSGYPGISCPDSGRAALCIWDIWRIERG